MNGYKGNAAELIKACALQKQILDVLVSGGLRAGDLAYYSRKIQDGELTLETVTQEVAKQVREDVSSFGKIKTKDKDESMISAGETILRALLRAKENENEYLGRNFAGGNSLSGRSRQTRA